MASFESVCAALCLMTQAASEENMPQPVSRTAMRLLVASGALCGLVLRDTPHVGEQLLSRARVLLSRARHVQECLDRYRASGYDVILPSDAIWPKRLFALGDRMPQFLFVRGNLGLLSKNMVAVAGSRDIQPAVWKASICLGRQLALEGYCLVSGGARGVDMAAEQGALEADGNAVIVPAQPESRFFAEGNRLKALKEGRLLVLYDTLPDELFSAQRAIARNHTIYALGEAAIAVAPRDGIGGTWRGAADCLSMRCTPVFVPQDPSLAGEGVKGLLARGAKSIDLRRPLRNQLRAEIQTDMFSSCGGEVYSCRQS